jgi:hypothetical protein
MSKSAFNAPNGDVRAAPSSHVREDEATAELPVARLELFVIR